MKPAWRTWLLFIAGLFLVDQLIFLLVIKGTTVFKNEDYAATFQHPASDIVILGASHAREGFIPSELQKYTKLSAFNLGAPGHNPLLMHYQSQCLLQRKEKPKLVIITTTYDTLGEVSYPHVLGPFMPKDDFTKTSSYFMGYRNFKSFRSIFLTDVFSSSTRILFSRCVSYLKSRSFDTPMPRFAERGYIGHSHNLEPGERPEHIKQLPFNPSDDMVEELKKTIALWKSNNIPVLLIDTPEFIGTRLGRYQYEQFETIMTELSKDGGVTFKSFNQPDMPELERSDYFRDGGWGIPNSHLNRNGAMWFNQIFSQWLMGENLLK